MKSKVDGTHGRNKNTENDKFNNIRILKPKVGHPEKVTKLSRENSASSFPRISGVAEVKKNTDRPGPHLNMKRPKSSVNYLVGPSGGQSLEAALIMAAKPARERNPGPVFGSGNIMASLAISGPGPTLVTDYIVLGSKEDAADATLLQSLGVTHVLNVATDLPNYHESTNKFVYEKLHIVDSPDTVLAKYWPQASAFLRRVESKGGRVLIHCRAGVSRSVALLLMHLISPHRRTLRSAHAFLVRRRPFIGPNDGFKVQLARFEVEVLGLSSIAGSEAGSAWDFYELNRLKEGLPQLPQTSTGCLIT